MLAETRLNPQDFIWPIFIAEEDMAGPIATMPKVKRLTIAQAIDAARVAKNLGIPALALFPCTPPHFKSEDAAEAFSADNLINRAMASIKEKVDGIGLIADVALDPYTSHGQDGLVREGRVLNDETVEALCHQAVAQAQAGCDIIAPSDMMDGRIAAIRHALDANGFAQVAILSYAAKYASAFYGPFRDAVGSASALGAADKKTYQMQPGNGDEALREIALDIDEGADMVMIKPAMAYLDIIHRAATEFPVPVLAYQVSGEYAMIEQAAQAGMIDGRAAMLESLLAIKRAGAQAIFTYAAKDIAEYLIAQ